MKKRGTDPAVHRRQREPVDAHRPFRMIFGKKLFLHAVREEVGAPGVEQYEY